LEQRTTENGPATATAIVTSRGTINVGKAKIILAAGTMPNATLVQNSFPPARFPGLRNVGERFAAHTTSLHIARIPRAVLFNAADNKLFREIEVGAVYVPAKLHIPGPKPVDLKYHVVLTSVSTKDPRGTAEIGLLYRPGVTDTTAQQVGSEDYVVFVAGGFGEMEVDNPKNHFKKNDNPDLTANCTLSFTPSANDLKVWDAMDTSSIQILEVLAKSNPGSIEYWHTATNEWKKGVVPPKIQVRQPSLIHESSTIWLGSDDDKSHPPVNEHFGLRGVSNVFVTGGALWPDAKSYNPSMVMAGLAQLLADQLSGAH